MNHAKTADWAATCPASGIIGLEQYTGQAPDISTVKAKSFQAGSVPVWTGSRFVGRLPGTLIDLSSYYGDGNKPYVITGFIWEPGTLTPFFRVSIEIPITNLPEGVKISVNSPYSLDGCDITHYVAEDDVLTVELFNRTPYDVVLASGFWSVIYLK